MRFEAPIKFDVTKHKLESFPWYAARALQGFQLQFRIKPSAHRDLFYLDSGYDNHLRLMEIREHLSNRFKSAVESHSYYEYAIPAFHLDLTQVTNRSFTRHVLDDKLYGEQIRTEEAFSIFESPAYAQPVARLNVQRPIQVPTVNIVQALAPANPFIDAEDNDEFLPF